MIHKDWTTFNNFQPFAKKSRMGWTEWDLPPISQVLHQVCRCLVCYVSPDCEKTHWSTRFDFPPSLFAQAKLGSKISTSQINMFKEKTQGYPYTLNRYPILFAKEKKSLFRGQEYWRCLIYTQRCWFITRQLSLSTNEEAMIYYKIQTKDQRLPSLDV